MAQKILGLEIGARGLRGVVIEGTARDHALVAHAAVPLRPRAPEEGEEAPDPRELRKEAFAEALSALVEELGVHPDTVIASLSVGESASTLLELPFTDTKKIEATLGFEVENLLPLDVDEVLYDYQVITRGDGASELLVGVTRLEDLEDRLEVLAGAGLDPRVVTLPALGAFRLAMESCREELEGADKSLAFVDLGPDRSLVAIVKGSADGKTPPRLTFLRSQEGGVGDLSELVHASIEDGSPEARRLLGALAPPLRQLRQSLTAARGKENRFIDGIRLTGEASKVAGIAPWLEKQLGLPVEIVEGFPGAEDLDPSFGLALGLALRGFERKRGLLNLRKGEFAFHGDLSFLRGTLIRLGAAAAMILLLLTVNAWAKLSTLAEQEANLDEALCSTTMRVLGTCETDFNIALSKLQGGETKAANVPSNSALEVMTAVIDKVTPDIGMDVVEIEAALDRLRVSGVVESFEAAEKVETALRDHECIGEVRQGRLQKNRDDKVELTLDATYVCGQGNMEAEG